MRCLTCGHNHDESDMTPEAFKRNHTDEACPANDAVVRGVDD